MTERMSTVQIHEQLRINELLEFRHSSRILQTWEPTGYLAKGTFAFIFRVINRVTGQEGALKFVPNPIDALECAEPGSTDELFHRSRFESSKREAEIMNRFRGEKNIVQYLEEPEYVSRFFVDENGRQVVQHAVLICMPLYHNDKEWRPRIANSREKRIQLGLDIARALMAFERNGVFHRDIKPGNVMLDDEGNFRLGDVGEAKLESDSTTIGYHGTKPYMAPEVYRQEHERVRMRWDRRADIYSLGIMLYCLFNHQQFPFLNGKGTLTEESTVSYRQYEKKMRLEGDFPLPDSERARLLRYSGAVLPRPAEADAALSRVILRACAFDREDRYQSARELYEDLNRCLVEEVTAEVQNKGNKFVKTLITLCAALAVLLACTLGVLIYSLLTDDNVEPPPTPTPVAAEVSQPESSSEVPAAATANTVVPAAKTQENAAPAAKSTQAKATKAAAPAPTAKKLLQPMVTSDGLKLEPGEDGGWTIAEYTGSAAELVIPAEVEGAPVTAIADEAFISVGSLSRVELPQSIVSMGKQAFWNCENLRSLNIPLGLVTMGDNPFGYSRIQLDIDAAHPVFGVENDVLVNLQTRTAVAGLNYRAEELVIPEGVESIGWQAFYGYERVKRVELPRSIRSIGERAFVYCDVLKEIVLPEGLESIGSQAFYMSSALESIHLPASLKSMGENPFSATSAKVSVQDGSAVFSVQNDMLLNRETMTVVTCVNPEITCVEVPQGVKVIGVQAFAGCDEIREVVLPEGLIEISDEAFQDCYYLESVRLPETLAILGANAFDCGGDVASINIPQSLTSIGEGALGNMGLKRVEMPQNHPTLELVDSFLIHKERQEVVCFLNSEAVQATVPQGIRVIGANAFYDCRSLTEIVLPPSVESIGERAFMFCESLRGIELPRGLKTIGANAFGYCDALKEIALPETLVELGRWAFDGCISLSKVRIPMSLTDMSGNVFGASPLTSVVVASNHALVELRDGLLINRETNAVIKCVDRKAEIIRVPEGIVGIESEAFAECTSLREVVLPESLTGMGSSVFSGCSNLQKINLPLGVTELMGSELRGTAITEVILAKNHPAFRVEKDMLIHNESGRLLLCLDRDAASLVVPNGVRIISDYVFENFSNLSTISLPDTLETVGYSAFRDCTALRAVQLPDSVSVIDGYAFSGCSSLADVKLPASLSQMDDSAFEECAIKTISLPEGLKHIPEWTFANCKSLETVHLPDSLESISEYAFYYCKALSQINLPQNLAHIGNDAFNGCENLREINIPASLTRFGGAFGTKLPEKLNIDANHPTFKKQDGMLIDWSTGELLMCETRDMKSIVVPEGVTAIADRVFQECKNLESVKLPQSLTHIGESAFYNCEKLQNLTLPSGLTSMGQYAFAFCQNLQEVHLPESLTTIADGAFWFCRKLSSISLPSGLTSIGDEAFQYTALKNVALPQTLLHLGRGALSECRELTSVSIPDGLMSIGDNPFNDSEKVELKLSANHALLSMDNGVLYDRNTKTLVALMDYTATEVTVPEGIERIGGDAFESQRALERVQLPQSLKAIGDNAFSYCENLSVIELPQQLSTIGWSAFSDCGSLKMLVIPSGVNRLEYSLFSFCDALETVVISDGVTQMASGLFAYSDKLATVYVPQSLSSIDKDAFRDTSGVTVVCVKGSYAETYAKDNQINYRSVSQQEYDGLVNAELDKLAKLSQNSSQQQKQKATPTPTPAATPEPAKQQSSSVTSSITRSVYYVLGYGEDAKSADYTVYTYSNEKKYTGSEARDIAINLGEPIQVQIRVKIDGEFTPVKGITLMGNFHNRWMGDDLKMIKNSESTQPFWTWPGSYKLQIELKNGALLFSDLIALTTDQTIIVEESSENAILF